MDCAPAVAATNPAGGDTYDLKGELGVIMDVASMSTDNLEEYDDMMVECVVKIEKFSSLASALWVDVLKELDKRGRVRLTSGSYDDIGNALIYRVR